jgi:hypothetical protein
MGLGFNDTSYKLKVTAHSSGRADPALALPPMSTSVQGHGQKDRKSDCKNRDRLKAGGGKHSRIKAVYVQRDVKKME